MPPINQYKCDKCGFALPSGWGGYMYVAVLLWCHQEARPPKVPAMWFRVGQNCVGTGWRNMP